MIRKKLKNLEWKKRYGYIKNIIFDEKKLNQKGARFQIIKFPAKTKIDFHFHKRVYETFYIRSGQGIFYFNNKKIYRPQRRYFPLSAERYP
ncbi:hypothetical protein CO115_05020 [Candidatus Falkowbacteria bacterium CG_4_9_14_3_um_filter_36_9]|uniref:Cupin 2 conserved barrel domain-containing protein n=1 Tax=Candidatus Falkowbacteria bacterium CG02_land_8_20_14_3_00_36_14 TaxID=1974560 RepID=A0A2M7DK90_9BACT|nr:MAG: hypothetical protein COS18_05715 [Candidatus Falkowbacteria bacterium CG02_land_8_20_14_3_00_36_14]PIX12026.1 MAG: hypothetical protein COZ73_01230 [Candidatus Falkowbacteria bacterium CG_4_8_14_3_um_filter_36_11]PJA11149.1 MAG: hypothetical protein COX67_01335 [Candidatus Falkowbacteria bacterium CG_4_10_14_0_2_um_filter_36_22]PJB18109.1 MAG: hypothetical protein CO115_05020 [Candidatus Falkowbacteria bacterium CG_4_9_14_3_um_filter_36_9]